MCLIGNPATQGNGEATTAFCFTLAKSTDVALLLALGVDISRPAWGTCSATGEHNKGKIGLMGDKNVLCPSAPPGR
jgi:hypothetical protein